MVRYGKERYGEEENGEEGTNLSHTHTHEMRRGCKKIQLHRNNAASEKHGPGVKGASAQETKKATREERGVAEYDYVGTTREGKAEDEEKEEGGEEEQVPRVASRHKRLYDRRSLDR